VLVAGQVVGLAVSLAVEQRAHEAPRDVGYVRDRPRRAAVVVHDDRTPAAHAVQRRVVEHHRARERVPGAGRERRPQHRRRQSVTAVGRQQRAFDRRLVVAVLGDRAVRLVIVRRQARLRAVPARW